MATYVLIAGAWHGAWCLEEIVPLLKARGHRVLAPDLAGLGDDDTPLGQVSFDGWRQSVADLVNAQDEPVILMGHSRGGMVITGVAEHAPENIRLLVYLTAGLPRDGETMTEAAYGPDYRPEMIRAPALTKDGWGVMPPEAAVQSFYHLVEPAKAARAVARLKPEPVSSLTMRAKVSQDRFGRVPRAFIECLRDQALTLEAQRRMQAASPCARVISIDSDHSPFYSAPQQLAEALDSLA